MIESRIELRLGRSSALGTPRLEGLCKQLSLDAFQKSVLLLACGNRSRPSQAARPDERALAL